MPTKPKNGSAKKAPSKAITSVKAKKAPTRPHTGLGKGFGALLGAKTAEMGSESVTLRTTEITQTMKQVKVAIQKQALISEASVTLTTPPVEPTHAVLQVKVGDIVRSPWQPRHTFDEVALHELADSIRQNGVIQPLICRRRADGILELVAGERRLRAATLAGEETVPVILVEAEDRRAAELAIIENIQREDLNTIEEAEGYKTLADTFHLTQQEVAERVGKARASIANALRLLDLPDETKQLVADGRLPAGHAKVLLSLKNTQDQIVLARRCITESLTVRSLERIVKSILEPRPITAAPRPDMPESHVRDLTDRMHRHFGTAIRLSPGLTHANGRHTKGVLEVDFYGNEDLDRILALLGIKVD